MMNNKTLKKIEMSKISMVFVICIINNLLQTWKTKEHLNSIMFLSLANILSLFVRKLSHHLQCSICSDIHELLYKF